MTAAVIRNVALAGAGGTLGKFVLDALLSSDDFVVTVLTSSSGSTGYPSSVRIVEVDYDSIPSLTRALESQDAVVSTLGKATGLKLQELLVKAAVQAGVKRFIPSEFGCDLENTQIRDFPIYSIKVMIEELLKAESASCGLTYTFIYNNVFLEQGITSGTLMNKDARTVALYDGGNTRFSTATMRTVGQAVVAVLRKYEVTKNCSLRIQDISLTPRELLEVVQSIDPSNKWSGVPVNTAKLIEDASKDVAARNFSPRVFGAFAARGAYAPGFGGDYDTSANSLLKIELMSREDLKQFLANSLNLA